MGNFYTNYTLWGPSQESVASALAGRSAVVTPVQDGCVVVFDEESDEQDYGVIAELASRLSGELNCPLLAVLNHDDDILWYQLYRNGELLDEYDSSPNYFDEEEEDSGPEGGDAEKLCSAFGVDTVERVESILTKSSFDEDGYTFAVERHADLVDALGISPFGVGAGFSHVSDDELPEGLSQGDLLRTRDLTPTITPGYYKLRLRTEKGIISRPIGWAPNLWAEMECSERDLSDAFHRATAAPREEFKRLGFSELGFKEVKRLLEPGYRDNGGINYLDGTGCCYGQLLYRRIYSQQLKKEPEGITIAFTAVFPKDVLSCSNSGKKPWEPPPNQRVVRIQSNEVAVIYETFLQQLKEHGQQPRHFPDLQSLKDWFDSNALELLQHLVRQGVFIRMTEKESEAARSKLGGGSVGA